mmetsp:Transcript_9606/g.39489  ORF Transcript_9606/g.39489 Transcript_9606/m.39489 type:complete len:246 (+) Transcript_9606:1253-1990(+)
MRGVQPEDWCMHPVRTWQLRRRLSPYLRPRVQVADGDSQQGWLDRRARVEGVLWEALQAQGGERREDLRRDGNGEGRSEFDQRLRPQLCKCWKADERHRLPGGRTCELLGHLPALRGGVIASTDASPSRDDAGSGSDKDGHAAEGAEFLADESDTERYHHGCCEGVAAGGSTSYGQASSTRASRGSRAFCATPEQQRRADPRVASGETSCSGGEGSERQSSHPSCEDSRAARATASADGQAPRDN